MGPNSHPSPRKTEIDCNFHRHLNLVCWEPKLYQTQFSDRLRLRSFGIFYFRLESQMDSILGVVLQHCWRLDLFRNHGGFRIDLGEICSFCVNQLLAVQKLGKLPWLEKTSKKGKKENIDQIIVISICLPGLYC